MRNIHFTGVGGAGMFALASLDMDKGLRISGSDLCRSKNTEILMKRGANIYFGHRKENVDKNVDLLVYSGAIKNDNPEVIEAERLGIKTMSRSKYLGFVTSKYENLVAISGSHGKTTVTSMLTGIMIDAGKDPTSIIGAKFDRIGGNSRFGNSSFAVCEACEYLDSFLDLNPKVGVILNVDNDHLDYFKDMENEKRSFLKFAQNCDVIVINADDLASYEISKKLHDKEIIYYGLKNEHELKASNISIVSSGMYKFDVVYKNERLFDVLLKIPGKHNILNALASIAVSIYFGLDLSKVKESIENFTGAERRFKFLGKFKGVSVFDDFAHHPTEIFATLKTAKQMKFNKVWVIFQPHTFSRTYFLLDEFAKVLSIADRVIITDILPVREVNVYGIEPEDLSRKIENSIVIKTFEEAAKYVKIHSRPGDMVMTMGGGDIYKCANLIFN